MSISEHDVVANLAERLAGVVRRQDAIEARFGRMETALGLADVAPARLAAAGAAGQSLIPAHGLLGPQADAHASTGADHAGLRPEDYVPPRTSEAAPPAATMLERPTHGAPPLVATRETMTLEAAPRAAPRETRERPALRAAPLAATRATTRERPTFEAQVGLAWLNRIGVVTLLLGVAFAYKTAVDNDWIGPAARVALGVVAALVTLAVGDVQWRRKHTVFAQGLTGLGLALLYLSCWAAFARYALVPQPVAFALMVATTIASGLLALRYASQAIAVLALLGGYATPIALATGAPHSMLFLGYVTLLNAATIVLSRRRVWPRLELLAAVATALLYAGWLASTDTVERPIATVFAAVFYAQYAIARSRAPWLFGQAAAPIVIALLWRAPEIRVPLLLGFALAGMLVGARRQLRIAPLWTALWCWIPLLLAMAVQPAPIAPELAGATLAFGGFTGWILWAHVHRRRPLGGGDLALLLVNPAACALAAAVLFEPAHHAYLGGFAVALAAIYLWLGRLVWRAAQPAARRGAYLAVAIALLCLTAATPLELTGFAVAIAWAIEGAALVWLARRSEPLARAGCGVLGLALGALVLALADAVTALPVLANLRCATFAIVAASLFASARRLAPTRALIAYVIAHAVVLLGLGYELVAVIEHAVGDAARDGTTTVAITLLIAGYGVALVGLGVVRHRARDRILGLAALALVVLKLYGSDVWSLGRGFQVAAFLALGVLLLAVSYLYSRYRGSLGRLWKDTPAG